MNQPATIARRSLFVCVVALVFGVALPTLAVTSNALFLSALNSITADELYHYVEVLADDVYEGRAAGSRGGHAASQFILKQLEEYHLAPAGADGGYLQAFSDDCRNILLLQPGDDPQLQNEIILVGAHYDHVGYGSNLNSFGPIGKIHNGADDNASGTSVILETIEALARSGLKTRRTILFAFWDAEERGLVGSRYWLAHPTLPLERVKFNITLDMVGRLRDEQLHVLGTRSGYGTRRLVNDPLDDPLKLDFSWDISANSDHWPFLERRIPIALLHTGLHSDYHRPTDKADRINRAGMREVCQYLLAMLVNVANNDTLPSFRDAYRQESEAARRTMEQPLAAATLANWPRNEPPPRLGLSWREDDAEPGSVFVVRIVEGTPAASTGLAIGDRIDELDGHPFTDAADFHRQIQLLLEAPRPNFTMLVERLGHQRTVDVKLPHPSSN